MMDIILNQTRFYWPELAGVTWGIICMYAILKEFSIIIPAIGLI